MKIFIYIFLCLCIVTGICNTVYAQITISADMTDDLKDFCKLETDLVKASIGTIIANNCFIPLEPGSLFSLNISLSGQVMPLFYYALQNDEYGSLDGLDEIYPNSGEDFLSPSVSLQILLLNRLHLFINGTYMPEFEIGNKTMNNLVIGGKLAYTVLPEYFNRLGLIIGAGYNYVEGKIERKDITITDGTETETFNLAKEWIYNCVSFELTLTKKILILTFYNRNSINFGFGETTSDIISDDNSLDAVIDKKVDDDDIMSLNSFAGMYLQFGVVNIFFESGFDWLQRSFAGTAGITISY